jgi:hypothetical protein
MIIAAAEITATTMASMAFKITAETATAAATAGYKE